MIRAEPYAINSFLKHSTAFTVTLKMSSKTIFSLSEVTVNVARSISQNQARPTHFSGLGQSGSVPSMRFDL